MFGYLDPASGSMILSVVAAGAAGIAVFFKSFGHRVWSAIAFWKKDDTVDTVDTVNTADTAATVDTVDTAEETVNTAETAETSS